MKTDKHSIGCFLGCAACYSCTWLHSEQDEKHSEMACTRPKEQKPKTPQELSYEKAKRILHWAARKAFCKTQCGDKCPLIKDDIEGGGGLAVDCKPLDNFDNNLKQEIKNYEL